jgi:uncharacterized membrane protein YhaH (DUF805 family)
MRRLFGFRGRLGRSGFAALSLGVMAVVAMGVPLLILVALAEGADGLGGPGLLILPVVGAAGWSLLALGAKRLHDLDLSALHLCWIGLVPVAAGALPGLLQWPVALLPWVWLCVARGTEGENGHGADPAPRLR